jgi:uncharacterized protein (TIGR02597 family)
MSPRLSLSSQSAPTPGRTFRSPSATRTLLAAVTLLGGLFVSSPAAFGQEVATTPVGAVTLSIAASATGSSYNISQISAPLLKAPLVPGAGADPVAPQGQMSGTITGVSSNTIQVTGAGWSSGQLAQTGFPVFVKITSGVNAGQYYYVTGNTADSLTVTAIGIDPNLPNISEETFKLYGGDTLLTLFGGADDGVIGGTAADSSAGLVDRVTLNSVTNNTTFTYYYNTDSQEWRRSGSGVNQGNTVIAPYTGMLYSRISTDPLNITLTGEVPAENLRISIPLLGVTLLSSYFPTDTMLESLDLDQLPQWRKAGINGVTIANSDKVIIRNGPTTYSYYYDGVLNYWRRSGSGANQNQTPVTVGSAIRVQRSGQTGQFESWQFVKNYNL